MLVKIIDCPKIDFINDIISYINNKYCTDNRNSCKFYCRLDDRSTIIEINDKIQDS